MATQPWLLELLAGRPMALGSVFERWRDPEGGDLCTCTIVTTDAGTDIALPKCRMRLVLGDDAWEA